MRTCLEEVVSQRIREKSRSREHIPFGRASHKNLPSLVFFNVRFAIGKVLHASGAAEMIRDVLCDEDECMDSTLKTDPGASHEQPELFYLQRKLQSISDQRQEIQAPLWQQHILNKSRA